MPTYLQLAVRDIFAEISDDEIYIVHLMNELQNYGWKLYDRDHFESVLKRAGYVVTSDHYVLRRDK